MLSYKNKSKKKSILQKNFMICIFSFTLNYYVSKFIDKKYNYHYNKIREDKYLNKISLFYPKLTFNQTFSFYKYL